jgi:hypothetical protein
MIISNISQEFLKGAYHFLTTRLMDEKSDGGVLVLAWLKPFCMAGVLPLLWLIRLDQYWSYS